MGWEVIWLLGKLIIYNEDNYFLRFLFFGIIKKGFNWELVSFLCEGIGRRGKGRVWGRKERGEEREGEN